MMIKITQKCSMGCTHCMNDAQPCEEHMDFGTFASVIAFQKQYGGPMCFITGGEPFEHPMFFEYLGYALTQLPGVIFTIATNGWFMQDKAIGDCIMKMAEQFVPVMFQVSTDNRYYPKQIDLSLPVFNSSNVTIISEIPKLYPQGRTLSNGLEWNAIGSKCCNVRGIARQINPKDIGDIIHTMLTLDRMCTPHIDIHGNIKVGESDLCPVCSNIYKSQEQIVQDIINFTCNKCNHVNKNLPQNMKDLLGVTV